MKEREGNQETINYSLIVKRNRIDHKLSVTANGGGHAQAQAEDIARALRADSFALIYEETEPSDVSELFRKLAYSDFSRTDCVLWEGKFTNNTPAFYVLKTRYYVRRIIRDYLDIGNDVYVKMTCGKKECINPFHNSYKNMKAAKTTGADWNLALAFASQGVPVSEIAKALKVHRSTIYRILNHERFSSRSSS